MWRVNELIPAIDMPTPAVVLHDRPDNGPFGVPHRKTAANFGRKTEQIKLSGEPTMVSLSRFFKLAQMGVEGLAGFPGGAIDALQHLP